MTSSAERFTRFEYKLVKSYAVSGTAYCIDRSRAYIINVFSEACIQLPYCRTFCWTTAIVSPDIDIRNHHCMNLTRLNWSPYGPGHLWFEVEQIATETIFAFRIISRMTKAKVPRRKNSDYSFIAVVPRLSHTSILWWCLKEFAYTCSDVEFVSYTLSPSRQRAVCVTYLSGRCHTLYVREQC